MPTTTSNETISRLDLVKRAFRRIGIDYPSTDQTNDAVKLLNIIVREIDTEGRWLWSISNTPTQLQLITGQNAYGTTGAAGSTIQPNILNLEWVEMKQGTSLRPLQIITQMESISNVQREALGGDPYLVYLEKNAQKALQRMIFFPTPASPLVAQYTYRRQLFDFLLPSDNPDFPQDWGLALAKRLSLEMAAEYGIPLTERQVLKAESDEAMLKRQSANAESPTPRPQRTQYY